VTLQSPPSIVYPFDVIGAPCAETRSCDLSQDSWRSRLQEVVGDLSITAAVLYGSFGTKHADVYSDVDLICITAQGKWLGCTESSGLTLDIYADSLEKLTHDVFLESKTNHNWLLNAFSHGVIVFDDSGRIASVISRARERWMHGPHKPSQEEERNLLLALEKLDKTAVGLLTRQRRSKTWRGFADLRMNALYTQKVNIICRLEGLWNSSFSDMLRWEEPNYGILQASMRAFLCSSSVEERLTNLLSLSRM